MIRSSILIAYLILAKAQQVAYIMPFASTSMSLPAAIAMDSQGNFFVANSGGAGAGIARVAPNGTVTVIVGGTGNVGTYRDGVSNVGAPYGIGLMPNGDIVYSDGSNQRVRRVTQQGVVTTITSGYSVLHGLDVDVNGNIYFVDRAAQRIYRLINMTVTLLVGGGSGTFMDGTTSLGSAFGIKIVIDGNLYVGERDKLRVRIITRSCIVNTLPATNGAWGRPENAFFDSTTNVYVVDRLNHKIVVVNNSVAVDLVNGLASTSYISVSPASMSTPSDAIFDPQGNIYICDTTNNRILRVTVCGYTGSWWNATSRVCLCTTGFEFDAYTRRCAPICSSLQYRLRGICTSCPLNAVCTGSTSFACQAGFTISSGGQSCEACTGSTYKNVTGNSACLACPVNSQCSSTQFSCNVGYQLNSLQNGCEVCAVSTYKNFIGNSACISCPNNSVCITSGFTCHPGYQPNGIGTSCETCPGGTYKQAGGNTPCQTCPTNSQCFGTFFRCNSGYQMNQDQSGCDACPAGFYKPSAGNHTCISVPSNSVSLGSYFECNAGFELNLNTTECVSCSSGTFKSLQSNTACLPCPSKSTCNNGRTFSCDIGFEPNALNTDCVSCPTGRFKPLEGNSRCSLCPLDSLCTSSFFVCSDGMVYDSANNRCVPSASLNGVTVTQSLAQFTQGISDVSVFYIAISLGTIAFLVAVIVCMCFLMRRRKYRYIMEKVTHSETVTTQATVMMDTTTDVTNQTLVTMGGGSELSIPAFLIKSYGLDYILGSIIAKGGFGAVYECVSLDTELSARTKGSRLVCKTIAVESERAQRLFYQEVSIMWFFRNHPNFVKVYAYSDSPAAIVMKYYPFDLDKVILKRVTVSYSKKLIVKLFREVCQAIGAMHEAGFAHCDIKPANVLIELPEMTPIISDFGITHVLHSKGVNAFQIVNVKGGSLPFAAPEILRQLKGDDSTENIHFKQTDSYSLALTLYEIVMRVHAWKLRK